MEKTNTQKTTRLCQYFKAIVLLLLFVCVSIPGFTQYVWEEVAIPDSVTCFDIAFDTAGRQYIATDCGLYFSDNEITWELSTLKYPGTLVYINENNTIYASGEIGMPILFRSFDNGITWDSLFCGDGGYASIVSLGDSCIFTGGWGGIYRSVDSALTWQLVLDTYSSEVFESLEKTSDNIIFAGSTAFITGSTLGGVYRSDDMGESWVSSGLDYHFVRTIGINSSDEIFAGTVGHYTTGSSKLFNSIDYGNNWDIVFEANRVYTMDINKHNEIAIGCMTDDSYGGVYFSSDDGINWDDITNNLPFRNILKLKFNNKGQLYSIIHNYALYKTITPVDINEKEKSSIIIYPNPAHNNINLFLANSGSFHFSIHDIFGKCLLSNEITVINGKTSFNISTLLPGVYLIVIKDTNNQFSTNKFIVN